MESYYAHIEGNSVTSVEVVTDEFVTANPKRYKGKWLKIGNGSNRAYCGKGFIYLPSKDKIIIPQPYPSWTLDSDKWKAPTPYPGDGKTYNWDERTLSWKLFLTDE